MAKDVYSINELSTVNEFLSDLNDWLVEHEGYDDVTIVAASLTIVDSNRNLIGTFTKWEKGEDIKFEPDFKPDMVEV